MNKKELTETVLRALRPVAEEEESREERADVDKYEYEKGKEAGEEIDGGDGLAKVQNLLVQALDAAEEIGDEKLVTQIGNTITFVTRSQVRGAEEAVDENTTSKYSDLAEKVISRIKESKKKPSVEEAKDWIQKAIKRPGALHRELGVPQDEDIPKAKINKAIAKLKKKDKDDEKKGTQLSSKDERKLRQLNLAKTLSKFN